MNKNSKPSTGSSEECTDVNYFQGAHNTKTHDTEMSEVSTELMRLAEVVKRCQTKEQPNINGIREQVHIHEYIKPINKENQNTQVAQSGHNRCRPMEPQRTAPTRSIVEDLNTSELNRVEEKEIRCDGHPPNRLKTGLLTGIEHITGNCTLYEDSESIDKRQLSRGVGSIERIQYNNFGNTKTELLKGNDKRNNSLGIKSQEIIETYYDNEDWKKEWDDLKYDDSLNIHINNIEQIESYVELGRKEIYDKNDSGLRKWPIKHNPGSENNVETNNSRSLTKYPDREESGPKNESSYNTLLDEFSSNKLNCFENKDVGERQAREEPFSNELRQILIRDYNSGKRGCDLRFGNIRNQQSLMLKSPNYQTTLLNPFDRDIENSSLQHETTLLRHSMDYKYVHHSEEQNRLLRSFGDSTALNFTNSNMNIRKFPNEEVSHLDIKNENNKYTFGNVNGRKNNKEILRQIEPNPSSLSQNISENNVDKLKDYINSEGWHCDVGSENTKQLYAEKNHIS